LSDPGGEPRLKIALAVSNLDTNAKKFWPEAALAPPLKCSWRYRPISPAEVNTGGPFIENWIWHQHHHREPARSGQSMAIKYAPNLWNEDFFYIE